MMLTTFDVLRPLVFVLACIPLAAGAGPSRPSTVSDAKLVEIVDARLAEWWLKADERRFDQIGWAPDVRTARELAAKHDRPLFLFTMDGRVNTGRC